MRLPAAIDRALDWTVVPGFSKLGYALRRGAWSDADSAAAGRDVVVTGGSSGLGEAACEQLALSGARVHMVVRNVDKGEDVKAAISERTGGELRVWRCDLSDLDSIREFCNGFAEAVPELGALVHNAGAMPGEREQSPQGFELGFATNVLGPFLMTGELLPVLRAGVPARVITVSSGGMYTAGLDVDDLELKNRDYDPQRFYAHTKRCEVILSELWAERLAGSGIGFHSMHPGWAATPGLESSMPGFFKLTKPLLRSSAEGADTISWLVSASEPGSSSGLFWHDRAPRPTHRSAKTRESDADRERLWRECERLTGWSLGGEREAGANGDARG